MFDVRLFVHQRSELSELSEETHSLTHSLTHLLTHLRRERESKRERERDGDVFVVIITERRSVAVFSSAFRDPLK